LENVLRKFRKFGPWSEEIGRNAHAHSFRFPRTRIFACKPKKPIRTSEEEIGHVVQRVVCVVLRVRFPRLRSSNNTRDEEIGACSHGIILTITWADRQSQRPYTMIIAR